MAKKQKKILLKTDITHDTCTIQGKSPNTLSKVAAAPPSSRSGDSAICAFFTAVIVFVRPARKVDQFKRIHLFIVIH